MPSLLPFLAISFATVLLAACDITEEPPSNQQILLVTTSDWDSVNGKLQCYQWRDAIGWEVHGAAIDIVVGKNGMHWGIGESDFRHKDKDRVKQEGDGRSPAGAYALSTAFGYAPPDSLVGLQFPYVHVTEVTQCIEDTGSAHYNRIIQGDQTPNDWSSTDHMLRQDNLYEWGVFVSHNYGNALPGGGSCIFLHGWRGRNSGTAGCTAMDIEQMKNLVFWLEEAKNPLLVQAPASEMEELLEELGFSIAP